MDKALYVAMTGASATLQAQTAVSHNLANVNTVGFKASLVNTEAFQVKGPGFPSRIATANINEGFDDIEGPQIATANPLDIALHKNRWLGIQDSTGNTAYTRAGDLAINVNGQLMTANGHLVLDDGGAPLTIPPYQSIDIASDGTISIIPQGETAQAITVLGRLNVVEGSQKELERSDDGLMRPRNPNNPLPMAEGRVLNSQTIESSNVNTASSLVRMIQLQRQFEMQIKVISHGDENAQSANSMLRLNG